MTPSESNILNAYNLAKERYSEFKVDTGKALSQLEKAEPLILSIPLWCDSNKGVKRWATAEDMLSIPLWCDSNAT